MMGWTYGFRSIINICATYDFYSHMQSRNQKIEHLASFGLVFAKMADFLENDWFDLWILFYHHYMRNI